VNEADEIQGLAPATPGCIVTFCRRCRQAMQVVYDKNSGGERIISAHEDPLDCLTFLQLLNRRTVGELAMQIVKFKALQLALVETTKAAQLFFPAMNIPDYTPIILPEMPFHLVATEGPTPDDGAQVVPILKTVDRGSIS